MLGLRPIKRIGFALVEVLVVVGVIGVLIGLMLPAVQSAREAARRFACASNLKQLVLAIHAYEGICGGFPPEVSSGLVQGSNQRGRNYSLHSLILPYLEQKVIYDALNFQLAGVNYDDIDPGNGTYSVLNISVFLCPSDPWVGFPQGGNASYRGNSGLCVACSDRFSGAFTPIGLAKLSDFSDGLSNTVAFSEKPVSSLGTPGFSPFRDWLEYSAAPYPQTPDDWLLACGGLSDERGGMSDSGKTWLLSGAIYTLYLAAAPPNSPVPDCGTAFGGGAGVFSARSYHPGGVNAAMADGSVHWYSSSTSKAVWRALSTRRGGEVIGAN
jgi:prepilin-type processing-associated H-X9-DG protein